MPTIRNGNLLHATEGFILQQTNCVARRPHGLSLSIANQFPYCHVYTNRLGRGNFALDGERPVPGSLEFFRSPDGTGPTIVCLNAQYAFGTPGSYSQNKDIDSYALRIRWFKECLQTFAQCSGAKAVAMPYGIGCGLAGGNWDQDYYPAIFEWEEEAKIAVVLYKL